MKTAFFNFLSVLQFYYLTAGLPSSVCVAIIMAFIMAVSVSQISKTKAEIQIQPVGLAQK